ncbi:putative protein TPRXL [Micropterus salmoides]|uniref:putative protein TPRXL n=1 Tax=Micropterus salmoides TaxID=27706 RepID=UPI0018ECF4B4|nr:putative protein TPRXL [Micropterus salmoides]
MMETKLWMALCALLLVHLGNTEHSGGHAATSSAPIRSPSSEAPAAGSASSLDPVIHEAPTPVLNGSDTNPSSRGTSRSSSNMTTEGETISSTAELKKFNDTSIVSPSDVADPEKNRNPTDQPTLQPPIPPSGSHAPTSHIPLTSTTTSPTHTAHATPAHTLTTTSLANTSHLAAPPLPDSTTPSNQPALPKTHSSTHVPHTTTAEPSKPQTTTTTTTTFQSNSTSSTSSPLEPANSEPPMLTSPQNTLRPDGNPETSSEAHPMSTITPPSSPSAEPKAQKAQDNTPSQLNIGGDTTMVHESPTLDPLLAGLVSAFIITAVIITLLIFLKLRRRDNRPEFRRLQDLPMDDMMEDTPLSMYSY